MLFKIMILAFMLTNAIYAEVLEFRNFNKDRFKASNELYMISEKYDGVRVIWNGKSMQTKRGNPIIIPECFSDELPDFSLDGELWFGYGKFEKIQSIASLKNPKCSDWEGVKYMIFDAPNEKSLLLSERLKIVDKFLQTTNPRHIQLINQTPVLGSEVIKIINTMLDEVLKKGREGLIIRKDFEEYKGKRSNVSYKLKPNNDAECKVIGYTQGKGKYKGKIGAIVCEGNIADDNALNISKEINKYTMNVEQKIVFRIGSGLSDKIRENPPKIGTIITYTYNGFTKNGIPKHARFHRIFNDKL